MKCLKVEETMFTAQDGRRESVLAIAAQCLRQSPQGGLTFAEQEGRLKVLDLLVKAEQDSAEEVLFEAPEAATLLRCVEAYKWGVIHPAIRHFVSLIRSMPDVEVKRA